MSETIRKSDKWIPWYFVMFFVVLVVLDLILCYIAISTGTGVVTDNSYKKGLEYGKVIEAIDKQNLSGISGDISFSSGKANGGTLAFALQDAGGNYMKNAQVTAKIIRPTQDGYDFDVTLNAEDNGYSASVQFPKAGQWRIAVTANLDGNRYYYAKRIVVE